MIIILILLLIISILLIGCLVVIYIHYRKQKNLTDTWYWMYIRSKNLHDEKGRKQLELLNNIENP